MTLLVIPPPAPAMLQSVCPKRLRGQVFSVLAGHVDLGYALDP